MLSKKTYKALVVLNVLGLAISSYLVYLHFAPEASDFCVLSDRWNCDIVNKSVYSKIFGIPVSILGAFAYLSFLVFSLRGLKKDQRSIEKYFFLILSFGLAFTLYLTGIEAFVLKTYCLFCVSQQVVLLSEWILVFTQQVKSRRRLKP